MLLLGIELDSELVDEEMLSELELSLLLIIDELDDELEVLEEELEELDELLDGGISGVVPSGYVVLQAFKMLESDTELPKIFHAYSGWSTNGFLFCCFDD